MGGKSSGSSGSQIMAQPSPYETAMAKIANEMFDKTSKLRDYSTRDLENFMNGGSFQGGNTGMGGYSTSSPYTLGGGGSSGGGFSVSGYKPNQDGTWSPYPKGTKWYADKDGNLYPGSSENIVQKSTALPSILNHLQKGKPETKTYWQGYGSTGGPTGGVDPNTGLETMPGYSGAGDGMFMVEVTPSDKTPGFTTSPYALGGGAGVPATNTLGAGGLGQRYNPFELPAFKPMYDMARKGIEDQYKVGLNNILANTARGGSLNRRLQDLEFNRAGDVGSLTSQISAPIIQDLYNKAYGAAWQTPQTALSGLQGAQGAYGQRLAAAQNADALNAQSQRGTMSSLGTLGGLAGKGLGSYLAPAGATAAATTGYGLMGAAGGAALGGLLGLL